MEEYIILVNCFKWHFEKVKEVTDEHESRRHMGIANKLSRRITELEIELGLRK